MGVRGARKGVDAAWRAEQEARLAYEAATKALEGKRKELWEAKRDSSRRSGRSRSPVGGAAAAPSDGALAQKVRELEGELAKMKQIVSSSSTSASSRRPASSSSSASASSRPTSSVSSQWARPVPYQRAQPARSGRW